MFLNTKANVTLYTLSDFVYVPLQQRLKTKSKYIETKSHYNENKSQYYINSYSKKLTTAMCSHLPAEFFVPLKGYANGIVTPAGMVPNMLSADSWGCCFCDRLPKCRPLLLKLLLLLLDAFCRLRRPRKQAERSEHPHFGHRRRRRRRRPSQPQPVNPAVRPPAGASSVRRKTPYLLRAAATVQSE